jgi:Ankyrin repeats (3 copies)
LKDSSLFRFKPAILIAADHENWETVQVLLEEGAAVNPNMRKFALGPLKDDLVVLTPLQAAVRAQNITMTRMLLSAGAHVDARPENKYGHTALQIAAMMGIKIRDLEMRDEMISLLLQAGASFEPPAGHEGYGSLHTAVDREDIEMTKILLRRGASAIVAWKWSRQQCASLPFTRSHRFAVGCFTLSHEGSEIFIGAKRRGY